MTPDEVVTRLAEKGIKAEVGQDSIIFDSEGGELKCAEEARLALYHYQVAMLESFCRPARAELVLTAPRRPGRETSAHIVGIAGGVTKGGGLLTQPYFKIMDEVESAVEIGLCALESAVEIGLCALNTPKNLPHYRQLEKKGKKW